MKKLVLLSFFIFSSCQTIYSDKKNEIDLITTGKWQIDYMEMRGIKLPFPEKNWVKYHKKGKFEGMEGSRYYVGKWEFDKKNRILKTIVIDEIIERKLVSITKNELIFSVEEQGFELIVGMKKQ